MEFPEWPYHNQNPLEGEYFKYLNKSPRICGASTSKYNPNNPHDIKTGVVYIGTKNIVSITATSVSSSPIALSFKFFSYDIKRNTMPSMNSA